MSALKKQSDSKRTPAVALRAESELHQIGARVLRLAEERGVPETEVHIDETIQALTRFANNTIHQNVAEQGLVVSIRTAAEGRTARVTTNRVNEDSLRLAIDNCLSLASHQPKDPRLLPMPAKQVSRRSALFSGHSGSHGGRSRPRR